MIAFFVPTLDNARALSRHLTTMTNEVDGPYRVFRGRWRGTIVSVYTVTGAADSAYVAGRLAARRGARVLVPVVAAAIEGNPDTESPGEALPVGPCWDLAAFTPLLRLLPDGARHLPLDPATLMPAAPRHAGTAEAPGIATLPFPPTNAALLRWLRRHHAIGLADTQMSGYADAATDDSIALRGFAIVDRVVADDGVLPLPPIALDARFESLLADIMAT